MLFSLLLILNIFSGSQKIIILFLMITVASFTSFLRMLGEKGILANKIIVVLIGICICIWPEAIVFTPLAAYEIFLDRHWIAGLVLVVGFARFCVSGDEADRLQAVDSIVNFDHLSICLFVFLERRRYGLSS